METNKSTCPNVDATNEELPPLTEDDKFVLQWLQEQAPLMQDENGIDLGRLRENLKLTPLERLRKFDRQMAGAAVPFNKEAIYE